MEITLKEARQVLLENATTISDDGESMTVTFLLDTNWDETKEFLRLHYSRSCEPLFYTLTNEDVRTIRLGQRPSIDGVSKVNSIELFHFSN